jgi:allophanate hydrolase
LLLPTAPFCPSLAACSRDPFRPNARLGVFTNFVNLCGLAAIAVPAGFGANGLPAGVTLVGPAWSEGRLAVLADRVHRSLVETVGATTLPIPPLALPEQLAAEETALFCVGAHMSGLPLNRQLTERGGRFLRAALTEPRYRLHALGDRPALVRRAESGAAIEGEVWALPTSAVGGLLRQVPPPLGFGTVFLEDGPCLGFLAEAAAIDGVADITEYRGWRRWLAVA